MKIKKIEDNIALEIDRKIAGVLMRNAGKNCRRGSVEQQLQERLLYSICCRTWDTDAFVGNSEEIGVLLLGLADQKLIGRDDVRDLNWDLGWISEDHEDCDSQLDSYELMNCI